MQVFVKDRFLRLKLLGKKIYILKFSEIFQIPPHGRYGFIYSL